MSRRLALPALAALLLAGCQVPVKPDVVEPPEPVAVVKVAPLDGAPAPAPETSEPAPEKPAKPDPMDTGAEVFDHLASRFSAPVCVKGQHNQAWRRRYAGYPAGFARNMEKVLPLMAYVATELERRELPAEFALIPIVESWYRPEAIGPGGPAGMWQMIASTARGHGIRIQPGYDGRLSPVEATEAALDHLDMLSDHFDGEWRAMAMAYNAGEYRILRALKASGDRRVSGESQLPRGLSRTTYDYVAKLHALACLLARPERHGLVLPREATFVPLARFELPAGAGSLDQAALSLGTDGATLRRLNPAYRQGRVAAGVPRTVLAPATPVALLARESAPTAANAPAAGATASETREHRVRRGDTLSRIARQYGVDLRQLYRLNRLNGRSILQPGQVLRIDP
ncbi:MAG: transglycosylase SLT domain-containing protein [Rhizobium sp.]|nr:transglycosylase SLT domain-containing protein [Rhizobium sp.]